jgi:hypothetical protein
VENERNIQLRQKPREPDAIEQPIEFVSVKPMQSGAWNRIIFPGGITMRDGDELKIRRGPSGEVDEVVLVREYQRTTGKL